MRLNLWVVTVQYNTIYVDINNILRKQVTAVDAVDGGFFIICSMYTNNIYKADFELYAVIAISYVHF